MRDSGMPILSENSLTVRKSPISTSWPERSTSVCLISSIFFSCLEPAILFWRRNVSRSSEGADWRKPSLCFAPRRDGLKFFFGASGLRKLPFAGAFGRHPVPEPPPKLGRAPDCPGREEKLGRLSHGVVFAGRL